MSESSPEFERPAAVIEEREIQFLRSYHLQKFYFPDEAGADVDELAADILANGLQQRIEITSDDTIIAGHRRRLAMMRLVRQGHEQFRVQEVVVRYDLAADGGDAIKKRFLEENRNRRHLTPMAYAKVSRDIYDAEVGTNYSDADLKQRIAEKFKVDTRTLERWWALLDLPSELCALIERKELPQQLGQQLLDYAKPEEIQELVKLARSSSPQEVKRRAREIVEERMRPKPLKEKPPERVFSQFLEIYLDMFTDYEAIAELVRQDLGERQQMLLYLRRFKQAEFVAQLLLSIVETSDRLESDELEYQPSHRRISIKEFLAARGRSLAPDTGPAAQRAKELPPLKLRKWTPVA